MNSPIHHAEDLDAAVMDAPPWLRHGAREGAPDRALEEWPASISPAPTPPIEASPGRWRIMTAGPAYRGDRAMATLQRQLALHPDQVPEPPLDDNQSLWPIAKRVSAVAVVAAIVAWGVVSVPGARLLRNEARPPHGPTTALSVNTDIMAPARSAPAVQMLVNHGLKEANALPQQPVETPSPAVAEPVPPPPAAAQPVPPSPMVAQPVPPPPELGTPPAERTLQLGNEEIATLVKRGKDDLNNGDLSSARLLLRRAAEAGNADAALALGASYDPLYLRRVGAIGAAPDPAQARKWYQTAADLGSATASQQLAKLAQGPQSQGPQ
jgi:hypothetical protein